MSGKMVPDKILVCKKNGEVIARRLAAKMVISPIEPTKLRPALNALVQDWPITILVVQMCAEDSSQETDKGKHPVFAQPSTKSTGVQIRPPSFSDDLSAFNSTSPHSPRLTVTIFSVEYLKDKEDGCQFGTASMFWSTCNLFEGFDLSLHFLNDLDESLSDGITEIESWNQIG